MKKSVNSESQFAEIQVSYKSKQKFNEMDFVKESRDCERILRNIWDATIELRESFYLVLLNRANRVLGWYKLSDGGITGTVVDLRIMFGIAVKMQACSIFIAHNHPSGNTKPSQTDLDLTKKIKQAGKLLDITLIDHLILTSEAYSSFADEGWLE